MRLKTSYSAREVASLTGLTARQLQGWDATRVFQSAIASRPTLSGGFTERRYTPVDLLELLALADLRRRGFAPAILRQMMDTLRDCFRRRLSETLDDAGELRLLTDGHGLFLRTRQGTLLRPARRSHATARHRRRAAAQTRQRPGAPSQAVASEGGEESPRLVGLGLVMSITRRID
jgi:DNA-binding transcriptional MerR regulator